VGGEEGLAGTSNSRVMLVPDRFSFRNVVSTASSSSSVMMGHLKRPSPTSPTAGCRRPMLRNQTRALFWCAETTG
jgi:hypothetical protein